MAAKAILGCVRECRQRYGTTVILDTLHGANTAKIRQYHMDENSHYGELSKEPVYRLRQILNRLQVREYLYVTADTYSIVRLLPKASELLDEDGTMLMKMAKEENGFRKPQKRRQRQKPRQRQRIFPTRRPRYSKTAGTPDGACKGA